MSNKAAFINTLCIMYAGLVFFLGTHVVVEHVFGWLFRLLVWLTKKRP